MTSKVPDNYEVPSFPSLSNPYLTFEFRKILYYKSDIIRFITLWCMFINAFICSISSFFTFISIRRKKYIPIIILVYIIYGGIVGIINGFLVGYAYWYVIKSLEFTVITLQPFFIGIFQGCVFRILEFPNIRMDMM
ncbi:hypothetical protein H8356DRAFT_1427757 [Neocallimastix lanati (nom. inval.)]|nr:hypothetical protein H8356DRAFT_1427757 [Neocallimastix sp. JGI-2020a]